MKQRCGSSTQLAISMFLFLVATMVVLTEATPFRKRAQQQDMIANLLASPETSPKRQQLIRLIANKFLQKADKCPESIPQEFCSQPLTFFLWLKKVRNAEQDRELRGDIRQLLVQLLASPSHQAAAAKNGNTSKD